MPGRMSRRRPLLATTVFAAVAAAAIGCGTEANDVKQPEAASKLHFKGIEPQYYAGAKLFVERCSGCHNLSLVGAEGGAQKVRDRERVDGPNFNQRKETYAQVLYAIENGGFSGAIMPQDIVVGKEADAVAAFLAKYAGSKGSNQSAGNSGA